MIAFNRSISTVADPKSQPRDERRQDARKRGSYSVWIALDVGMPVRECILWDESEGGAKLSPKVPNAFDLSKIPEVFFVYMSSDATAPSRRRCQVMWRSLKQIGVKFLPNVVKATADLKPGS